MTPEVLVVEDEPAILELISVHLNQSGYKVKGVPDAESALVVLRNSLPSLMLVDWMLPGQSGLALAKRLREDPRTRELPIIMVTARADEAWQALHQYRHDDGACLGAFEAWLLLRGMRTLFPRVERQSATALELARRLEKLPGVRVLYPGLPSHPGHEVARRQMHGGFGGMLSIRLDGGRSAALAAAGKMELFVRATSLGGVESLVEHRETAEGADTISPPDLLRLSVGIEDIEDLWQDLAQALRPT
jgi:O-acetylhomoserine/O-acetylserine sulfhydrylase-like pyridoxal-dependent enzyme